MSDFITKLAQKYTQLLLQLNVQINLKFFLKTVKPIYPARKEHNKLSAILLIEKMVLKFDCLKKNKGQ